MTILMQPLLEKEGYFQLENDLDRLRFIQEQFSRLFPFENLDVLIRDERSITESFLIEKMLNKERGGLCYELNGLLHLVLKQLGFDVILAAATIWSEGKWVIDRTHAINLYKKDHKLYLIDSGFGNNLCLQPLQMDGEPVVSPSGMYRLRTEKTERGSIVFEHFTKAGWELRYAFYPDAIGWEDLNRMKELIHFHQDSPFKEKFLFAQIFKDGTVSITENRFHRKRIDGQEETIPFHSYEEMLQKLKEYGTQSIYEAAALYLDK